MNQNEREFFISRTRLGIYRIEYNGITLTVYPPTLEDEFELAEIYNQAFNKAFSDDLMTEEQMTSWMMERGLWSVENDQKLEGIKTDIEKLKVGIYESRYKRQNRDTLRLYCRAAEKAYMELMEKKKSFFNNTCEGMALLERSFEYIRRCTFYKGSLYSFTEDSPITAESVWAGYTDLILNDGQIRELARTEPWRSMWNLNNTNTLKLFHDNGRELNSDQKGLLNWSRIYDNVHESMDCPSEDVINDDDSLDGWFILQKQKRDKQRGEAELEDTVKNDKIRNSSEVYLPAKTREDIERINNLNDPNAKMIKKQRMILINRKGEANQGEFQDEKLKLSQRSTQQFKDKVRGG